MSQVYFVTNRRPTGSTSQPDFGTKINHSLAFGKVEFDSFGKVSSVTLQTEAEFVAAIRKTLTEGREIVNHIHGYDSEFRQSLEGAKEIQERYGTGPSGTRDVVAFSWPSNGKVTHYYADKRDARRSGAAIAATLDMQIDILADLGKKTAAKVHVTCQSMGNYAFQHAVQFLSASEHSHITEVILSAPVVSRRAFERDYQLGQLSDVVERVSVYFNPGDYAAYIPVEYKPMARNGPRHPTMIDSNVALINCQDALMGWHSPEREHRYLHLSDEMRVDVGAILDGVASSDKSLNREYDLKCNHYRLQKGKNPPPRPV